MSIVQAALMVCALGSPPGRDAVLLDFTAPWCGPCKQMEPTLARLAAQGYPVRKIDIDREPALASQFRVTGVPCFVMLVNGQETARLVGSSSYEQLVGLFHSSQPSASGGAGSHGMLAGSNAGGKPSLPAQIGMPPGATSRQAAASTQAVAIAPDLVERLLASSVRIRINDGGGNSVGTGTIIDAREGEALVLTCGHIFRDSKGEGRITVDLHGIGAPQQIPARMIGYDLESDVGFLSFRPNAAVAVARVAPAGYTAKPGDSVVSVGCNHGDTATARVSRVTTIDKFLGPPNLQVSGAPVQGRSGGGLFNAEGYVIGVCNAADPADDEGLYAALPAIHAELNQWALSKFCLPAAATIAVAPPTIPARMPNFGNADPAATVPTTSNTGPTGNAGPLAAQPLVGANLPADHAPFDLLANLDAGAEVVCIIRSLADPRAKSRVVVLDRATPQLLQQLADDQRRQEARTTTGFFEPEANAPAASAPRPAASGDWVPSWKRPAK